MLSDHIYFWTLTSACKPEYWGKDCTSKCGRCFMGDCDEGSGKCKHGCLGGYQGAHCHESKYYFWVHYKKRSHEYICHIINMHVIFKLNNCKVTKDHKHWRLVITAMRFRGMRFVSRLWRISPSHHLHFTPVDRPDGSFSQMTPVSSTLCVWEREMLIVQAHLAEALWIFFYRWLVRFFMFMFPSLGSVCSRTIRRQLRQGLWQMWQILQRHHRCVQSKRLPR